MEPFILCRDGRVADIVLEPNMVYGMPFMTGIFCEDIERVCGVYPEIVQKLREGCAYAVLVATCGSSELLDTLEREGFIDLSDVRGKREVYGIFRVKYPVFGENSASPTKESKEDKALRGNQGVEDGVSATELLVIAGSDKRGTIYGMFRISEIIGVSSWVFFADAVPKRREEVVLTDGVCMVSKEPSVCYRGFFINDEQPCFGNWAKEKFGSAKPGPLLYRHIFELLLRLKGNYLWPAMWRSDFSLDNLDNAELADRMGVIIGASHHEPCCRSGGEFQKLRHKNKAYGEDWSFLTNAKGISEFWKDGLLRNREFESLITIGMRGENDSYLMPKDATLEDNINVLKAAITEQKRLIAEYGNHAHPQLLALYKEVEDYYHGDADTAGLKDWEVLKDDILMLCDDNFGNVRTLPGPEAINHPGGYGMYYHFDYYGGPVSYLWMNSTPLTKIWEQMGMAYDYGVRKAWIVNVGDIKNQELPLSYFLDLAYDFDTWGTKNINRTAEYTKGWLRGMGFEEDVVCAAAGLLGTYTKWNGTCRPEVLSAKTYHPEHFGEAWRLLDGIGTAQITARWLWKQKVGSTPLANCFYELVYYPVMASANILRMQLYAGINQHLVFQGKKSGNNYPKMIEECINLDRKLAEEYHNLLGGKWNHMQSVFHIGYPGWNDEEWQYPRYTGFFPVTQPRLLVSVIGGTQCTGGNPWRRKTLKMMLASPTGIKSGFEVANGGQGELNYRIEWDADWLEITEESEHIKRMAAPCKDCFQEQNADWMENNGNYQKGGEATHRLTGLKTISEKDFAVCLKPELFPEGKKTCSAMIHIYGENCEETAERSENSYSETRVDIEVQADLYCLDGADKGTYVEFGGILSVEATHFCSAVAAGEACYRVIEDYGKTLGGIKVFPVTAAFGNPQDAPYVVYKLYVGEAGDYTLTLYCAPSNPVVYQGKMCVAVRTGDGEFQLVNTIPDEGYVPWQSPAWSRGVLEQIHLAQCKLSLKEGSNLLYIAAIDPAVVLEKLVLVREGVTCPETYLGPTESFCITKSQN
ncbi:MAG: glycosyl hydrolase 115 family protein [Lachnospiraceae bacterium]|nr:glycosyl hydrolase 115 family protein [Lachnospiraceae bacterium]